MPKVVKNEETGDYLKVMAKSGPIWTVDIDEAFKYYNDSLAMMRTHVALCRKSIGSDRIKAVNYVKE